MRLGRFYHTAVIRFAVVGVYGFDGFIAPSRAVLYADNELNVAYAVLPALPAAFAASRRRE